MKSILAAILLMFSLHVQGAAWTESKEIGDLFERAEVEGTFVLYDVTGRAYSGHDRERAETRFVPASTFKIPNSLIALATGAVDNVDEVLPYGGRPQPFKVWERDMALREAITLSNVAIYQEVARRIGLDRMRDNVSRMDYGNNDIGAAVDSFWLTGPLRISAVEQARFLSRLARNELPFPRNLQETVREIVLLEHGQGWTLYGKSGWENAPDPGVGWWVGWVQRDGGHFYAFALNMDIRDASDAGKRVELGKQSLAALGIIGNHQESSGTP